MTGNSKIRDSALSRQIDMTSHFRIFALHAGLALRSHHRGIGVDESCQIQIASVENFCHERRMLGLIDSGIVLGSVIPPSNREQAKVSKSDETHSHMSWVVPLKLHRLPVRDRTRMTNVLQKEVPVPELKNTSRND